MLVLDKPDDLEKSVFSVKKVLILKITMLNVTIDQN